MVSSEEEVIVLNNQKIKEIIKSWARSHSLCLIQGMEPDFVKLTVDDFDRPHATLTFRRQEKFADKLSEEEIDGFKRIEDKADQGRGRMLSFDDLNEDF